MVFNSYAFAVFFVVVYAAYACSMRRVRVQNAMLLAASYFFYGWWDWRFLALLIATTVVDFVAAILIDRGERSGSEGPGGVRRWYLIGSMVCNLGVLAIFKYFDFFSLSATRLFGSLGLEVQPWLLDVALPVGVSFYTFQSMSYTIDVYRGRLPASRNILDFALFVAFFPQLVAGPIVRAVDFLPQVQKPRQLKAEQIFEGGHLIFWGLFKKVVIADNLAPVVDRVFSANPTPSGAEVLVAVYAFAFQIYGDFSGYSDMARGLAKTMGFEFNLNFNLPYFSTNASEFWRRWHISLSSWLRDYLYIPLGGNRRGPARTYFNLMATMLLGGLWHGAAWTFVVWGAYQGVLLCLHRALGNPNTREVGWGRWARVILLFHAVCLGWLFFRAESVQQAWSMLGAVLSSSTWSSSSVPGLATLATYVLPLVILEIVQFRKDDLLILLRAPAWCRGVAYAGMFYVLILFGGAVAKPFIYFQF